MSDLSDQTQPQKQSARRRPRQKRRATAGRRGRSRRRTRPRDRRWTVPTSGVRPPLRVGWRAILDLDPGELVCVQWLLRRLERRDNCGTRALARECGISSNTAGAFLRSNWKDWARAVLNSRNGSGIADVEADQPLARMAGELRITIDNADAQP